MTEVDRAAAVLELTVLGLPPRGGAAALAHAAATWARSVARTELPPAAAAEILAGAVRRALEVQDREARAVQHAAAAAAAARPVAAQDAEATPDRA